jgi:tetratricopeptide (TPR) repeat protein
MAYLSVSFGPLFPESHSIMASSGLFEYIHRAVKPEDSRTHDTVLENAEKLYKLLIEQKTKQESNSEQVTKIDLLLEENTLDPKDGSRGRTADSWLTAAGEQGIPVAFIIKGGKVAWIGHPTALDQPLAKVVAGDWDFEAAARERREQKAAEERLNAFLEEIQRLIQAHKYQEAIAGLDKAISATPELEHRLGLMKVSVLAESEEDEALTAYGSRLLDSIWKDNSDALNYLALMIVITERKTPRPPKLLKLALRAAERANDLNYGESGRILDTLARVCFASGDPERAARLEEKALSLAERDVPPWRERLETYRKAAGQKSR